MTRKRRYAEDTSVPIQRSQAQIRQKLERIDATSFMFGSEPGRVIVGFLAHERYVRIEMPLPDEKDQTERAVWRRILLVVTARVTEIQEGILDLDGAFMPFIALQDGRSFGHLGREAIAAHYSTGQPPALLPPRE